MSFRLNAIAIYLTIDYCVVHWVHTVYMTLMSPVPATSIIIHVADERIN